MKRIINTFFLLLPPLVGTIVASILYCDRFAMVDFFPKLLICGSIFSLLGVPMIIFNKQLAIHSARIYSRQHHNYYREAEVMRDDAMEDYEPNVPNTRRPMFMPTELHYKVTLIGSVFSYVMGLIFIVLTILSLRIPN